MDSLKEIIHKNYKLTMLMQHVGAWSILTEKDANGQISIKFTNNTGVRSSYRLLKYIGNDNKVHVAKIKGHPEFDTLVGNEIYLLIGNVIGIAFDIKRGGLRKNPDFTEYLFRSYLYDLIMDEFTNGIKWKQHVYFHDGAQYEISTNADVDVMSAFEKSCEKFLINHFKDDYEAYVRCLD